MNTESGIQIRHDVTSVDEVGNSYSSLKIIIPEDHYIYANPKGPGTGLATEISSSSGPDTGKLNVRYPEGIKYTPPGEKDHVYVYRNRVSIPFSWKGEKNSREIKISFSALLCSSTACLPVRETLVIPRAGLKSIKGDSSAKDAYSALSDSDDAAADRSQKNSVKSADDEISESSEFTPRYIEKGVAGLLQAVLFGLIAGFILNFMPCVLPVVSLKIMAFVENADQDRRVIALQGFLFSAGIILSFFILAALASFWGYKWGGLFQHGGFLIFMTAFVLSMAMSMFGLFSLNIPSFAGTIAAGRRGKYSDAFVKGIIATLLATPCSGPFLGGTLAWAMTGSPLTIFVVFLSVGAGMALPYLVLALRPGFVKYIPAPGEWMEVFEKTMAFLLVFTAVYLLGIVGEEDRMGTILFLTIFCFGLWQYGKFGSIVRSAKSRILSFISLVLIIVFGYFLSFHYIYSESEIREYEKNIFTIERLNKNRKTGIISVVEFTADWCPNCKLVEKITLQSGEVSSRLSADDIDFMVADITKRGSTAEELMKRLGSESIPFLAMFPPGSSFSSPLCLRDIYGTGDFTKALNMVRKGMNE